MAYVLLTRNRTFKQAVQQRLLDKSHQPGDTYQLVNVLATGINPVDLESPVAIDDRRGEQERGDNFLSHVVVGGIEGATEAAPGLRLEKRCDEF